jgi:hypothetical protein
VRNASHRIEAASVGRHPLQPIRALTVGAIASELRESIHRVQYAIKTRGIEPESVAGNIRMFAPEAVECVAAILREIDRQAAAGQGGDDARPPP